ncbi:endospore germination permease [Paenibacillus sp. CN-4]|uniref:GerAB/ArcD/ProY family transporter n=1 Tax=Paenibacillus nanchangensis TaxID=3348343 RepID=UPI00397C5522
MDKYSTKNSSLILTMVLFEIGSTTLFLLGAKAGRDAWLAMLIGALAGLLLLLMYLRIYTMEPDKDLYEISRHYLGKLPGNFVSLLFTCYFIYEASRNLRDLGELTSLALLDKTPTLIIMLITILVVANTVRYGAEVLFLACTALIPVIAIGYGVLLILIMITGMVHWEFLSPVLEKGILPVLDTAIPEMISFPFGQLVLFLVFFKYVHKNSRLKKGVLWGYSLVALLLIVINQLNILILGPALAAGSTYPLLQVVQIIQVAKVLERTDVLFVLILFLGLGAKVAAFFLGAVLGLQSVSGKNFRYWVIPAGGLIFALTFLSSTYTEFIRIGLSVVVTWSSPVFQILLPLLLFGVMLLRKNRRSAKKDG